MKTVQSTMRVLIAILVLPWGAMVTTVAAQDSPDSAKLLRPPAVPLVTIDPYTSCWSFNDRLFDDWPRHWTGRTHGMAGLARVDGKAYRFMGGADVVRDAAEQLALRVHATRTEYDFGAGRVRFTVSFVSPLLMDDLDVLSRPASYVTITASSADGQGHDVQFYLDVSAEWAVNLLDERVQWGRLDVPGLDVMRLGTVGQPVLGTEGDNIRINWGHVLLAAPKADGTRTAIGHARPMREAFAAGRGLPGGDEADMPRAAHRRWPALAVAMDAGKVAREPVARHVIIG